MAYWLASLAYNHRLSALWVCVPRVAMLRTSPNMTLAVEREVTPQLELCYVATKTGAYCKVHKNKTCS